MHQAMHHDKSTVEEMHRRRDAWSLDVGSLVAVDKEGAYLRMANIL